MELTCIKKMTPKICHCLSLLGSTFGSSQGIDLTPYGIGLLSGTCAVVFELNPARKSMYDLSPRIIIAITF